jgi:catechol 2,3-dioxygenase-like lactoylglutathione lyase family enzyme
MVPEVIREQRWWMAAVSRVGRFDHVVITVGDLESVTAFFVGLGLDVQARMLAEGEVLDVVIAIPDSSTEIVMLGLPDAGNRDRALEFRQARPRAWSAGRDGERAGSGTFAATSPTCRCRSTAKLRTDTD